MIRITSRHEKWKIGFEADTLAEVQTMIARTLAAPGVRSFCVRADAGQIGAPGKGWSASIETFVVPSLKKRKATGGKAG